MSKTLMIRGKNVLESVPQIVVPLIGKDESEIRQECELILPKRPDLIEWRADFFSGLGDRERVLAMAETLRELAGDTPLIFTIRAAHEGGQGIALDEGDVLQVLLNVCQSRLFDLVDFELSNSAEHLQTLHDMTRQTGTGLIMSYHNFSETPTQEVIKKTLFNMQRSGADVAKIAVMPHTSDDVLSLLQVTGESSGKLDIPLVTMAMDGLGVMSRLMGWQFGSAFTFAVGHHSSAPGQVPIERLRQVIQTIKDYSDY